MPTPNSCTELFLSRETTDLSFEGLRLPLSFDPRRLLVPPTTASPPEATSPRAAWAAGTPPRTATPHSASNGPRRRKQSYVSFRKERKELCESSSTWSTRERSWEGERIFFDLVDAGTELGGRDT